VRINAKGAIFFLSTEKAGLTQQNSQAESKSNEPSSKRFRSTEEKTITKTVEMRLSPGQRKGAKSIIKVVVVLVHGFHNKLFKQHNRFGLTVVNHKALDQVVNEQHHRQHGDTDNFKHVLAPGLSTYAWLFNSPLRSPGVTVAPVNQTLKGISYVSVWVLIWGFAGSLIDLPLLENDIYTVYSPGQAVTFGATALACIALAIWLSPRWLTPSDD